MDRLCHMSRACLRSPVPKLTVVALAVVMVVCLFVSAFLMPKQRPYGGTSLR